VLASEVGIAGIPTIDPPGACHEGHEPNLPGPFLRTCRLDGNRAFAALHDYLVGGTQDTNP